MNLAKLRETWSGLETRSQLTLVGSALLVVVTLFLVYSFASKPSYSTLATGLDPGKTAQAESALSSAGIPFRVGNGGTSISVQAGSESDARVALAQKGVLNSGHVGFELFDKSSLGTTTFQQNVDYQRALEGEIANTIEQIQGVTSADVQLVLPQDTLFADKQSKATAAVLVNGGSGLDASTITGIAHLVASSVKGLDSQNVTITDETGGLLWPTSVAGGSAGMTKLQADSLYAAQLGAQINQMLTATLGAGKAQANVHADLDVDQTTRDTVTYAKKGVPLQTQTDDEKLASKGGGSQLPAPAGTSTNTTAPSYAAGTSGNGSSNYDHQTSSTTYGYDKTIEHSVLAPGTVNRIDVALLVDNSVPAAQVASLKKSVASLAGITPARGDTLAVSQVSFAKQPKPTTAKSGGPLSKLGDPMGLAKDVVMGLGALIFLLMMRRALKRREGEQSVPEPTWLRELEGGMTLAELEGSPTLALPVAEPEPNPLREQVEEIARNQPQAIASQVSQWMKE